MRFMRMYYANTVCAFIKRHGNTPGLLILNKLWTKQKARFIPQMHLYLYFLIIIIIVVVHNSCF